MSFDEFDPDIERLFNRAPDVPNAQAFEARVMGRLQSSTRSRGIVLSVAGLVGGCVAASEMMNLTINLGGGRAEASMGSVHQETLGDLVGQSGHAAQGLMDNLGLGSLDMASLGGGFGQTQVFMVVAAVLLTLLTFGAVKLYQQV